MALGIVGSVAIVPFAPTRGLYITIKEGMGSIICSPTISKDGIVEF
jgi:hypothetical protein